MYIKTDLNDEQKASLQKMFRQLTFVEPHVAGQQLHLKRLEAIALLDRLVKDYPDHFTRKQLVYHYCSEAPVGAIADGEIIKEGWACPQCEEEVDLEDLKFDLMYRAVSSVDFLNPNDGLVRYWAVDYFPYFLRGYSQKGSEPAMALSETAAILFDEKVNQLAIARQKAFEKIEREYQNSVEVAVMGLPQ
jgi:hypothetical protein